MSKRLLLNSFTGTAFFFANVIVAFIMSPVYIRTLGNRDYGLWELVLSVIGYMGLLDLGIGGSLVRFVSIADGRQDRLDLQQTMSTACAFFLPMGVIAFALFMSLSVAPGLIAGHEVQDVANLGTVFLLLGIDAAMQFSLEVFTATLVGLQRHYLLTSVRLILLIVRACLSYYLLLRYPGKGLLIMALLQPCFTAVQAIIFITAVIKDKTIPPLTLSAVRWQKAKELARFSVKSLIMMTASQLQNQSIPMIIGHIIGLSHIVYFVIPNRLVSYAKGVARSLGYPLTPYFGAAIGKGDRDALRWSWLNTSLALQSISLAVVLLLFFCGENFLELWIGSEYSATSRPILLFLLAGLVAESLAANAYNILTAQGRHGRTALMWLALSIVSIPLAVYGGGRWGVVGITAGTAFVAVAGNLVTILMACAVMEISLINFFRRTLLRILLPLLIMALSLLILKIYFMEINYINLILQSSLSFIVYISAIWFFLLSDEIKNKILIQIKLIILCKYV